jgi:hypothetical protein
VRPFPRAATPPHHFSRNAARSFQPIFGQRRPAILSGNFRNATESFCPTSQRRGIISFANCLKARNHFES